MGRRIATLAVWTLAGRLAAQEPSPGPPASRAELLKILSDSRITYEMDRGPVSDPVDDLRCGRRGTGERIIQKDGVAHLEAWMPAPAALPHFEQAEADYDAQRYPEAAAAYARGLALDPDYGPGWLYSGDVPFAKGDYALALERYRRALALDPTLPQGHRFAAHALEKLGRLDEAQAELIEALAQDPGYDDAWTALAGVAKARGSRLVRTRFDPHVRVGRLRDGKVEIGATDEASAPWFAYAICQAVWHHEETYRVRRGRGGPWTWSTTQELECMANFLDVGLDQIKTGATPPLPEADAALVRRLDAAAKEHLAYGFVVVEVLGVRCPRAAAALPDDMRQEARDYLARLVLTPVTPPGHSYPPPSALGSLP
jgi:tetratricopeptide (TPR) repeat protein